MLPEVVQNALAAAAPAIERMEQQVFDDMYCDDTKQSFVRLSKGIQGCVTCHLFKSLQQQFLLPSNFVLEEDEVVSSRRASLCEQLKRLGVAQGSISNIQEAVRTETTTQSDLLSLPSGDIKAVSSSCSNSGNKSSSSSNNGNNNSSSTTTGDHNNQSSSSRHANVPDSPWTQCNGKLVAAGYAAAAVHKSAAPHMPGKPAAAAAEASPALATGPAVDAPLASAAAAAPTAQSAQMLTPAADSTASGSTAAGPPAAGSAAAGSTPTSTPTPTPPGYHAVPWLYPAPQVDLAEPEVDPVTRALPQSPAAEMVAQTDSPPSPTTSADSSSEVMGYCFVGYPGGYEWGPRST